MISLFLVPNTWDLCLDLSGNVAVCSEPYRISQDVATACRLFYGELWWNTAVGTPNAKILNEQVSLAFCQAAYQQAALTVPGVTSASALLAIGNNRELTGQVQVNGGTIVVSV
jgi:hypothetical protein